MMNKKSAILLTFALICVFLSVWQMYIAQTGLDVIYLKTSNPPVTIISPSNILPASRPTVLIAHGFAGSSVLMRGFALTLAHAGYTTVSWDFQGHGENTNPLVSSSQSNDLLQDAESALVVAETTGLIDQQRIAILGHSMGSGVALSYGMTHPDTDATIAISPVNQTVTPSLPHNLMLMVGSLESQFISNAEQLLALSGGQGGDITRGTARNLVIIPYVEHISILFSPKAHSTAGSWLDGTFGSQPGAFNYSDHRILWFGLGILGFILLAKTCINLISPTSLIKIGIPPLWLRMLALFLGGIAATFILWLLSISGVKLNQSLGLLVGGYLIVWFGAVGVISLLILRPHISRPTSKELIKGLVAFAALWLGVGLLGNIVWLPWLLIPCRLWLWIPSSIILLPWFFTIGYATKDTKPGSQLGWWLYQSIIIVLSLFLATRLNPELGFLFIILPLVPVMIGLHMLVISPKHGTWAYASSGALFTAWLILAVFPLK
jgi:pimeloyl-ACP methyl ester carboxylesterase